MNDIRVLMKCGHTSQGTDAKGNPVCVICDCFEVETNKPNLDGRKARCTHCHREADSKERLPFFEHRPDKEYDSYYCGCLGWD